MISGYCIAATADSTRRKGRSPSDYFRRQCFVSVEEVEPAMDALVSTYPESVVFASDYPHADGTFPGSTKDLLETDRLTAAQVRAVMRDNAARLYGLGR